MLLMIASMPLSEHDPPQSMVGSTPCLNIAMLLMSIDIMFARSHHATGERRHATLEHGHLLSKIGRASCREIAMLLVGIDIMTERTYHATDERQHATFRA